MAAYKTVLLTIYGTIKHILWVPDYINSALRAGADKSLI